MQPDVDTPTKMIEAHLLLGARVQIDPKATSIGGAWQGKDPTTGMPRPWDPETLGFFYEQANKIKNPVILDIGANTGIYCLLPVLNRSIRGYAFEPNPEAYRILKSNLTLNALQNNIQTVPVALSNKKGIAKLKIPASGTDSGLACLGNPQRFDGWYEAPVPMDTLDNVAKWKSISHVDLIKIDTEGCELPVLLGGEQLIRSTFPRILLEFEERNTAQFGYHPDEIAELLTSWGYEFRKISASDAFFYKKNSKSSRNASKGSSVRPTTNTGAVQHARGRTDADSHSKPIVVISSCSDMQQTGDAKYNGGLKLYNLWVKLLREKGYQAYVVTFDGNHTKWLEEHQPHISIAQLARWKRAGLPLKYVTGWLDSKAFIDLADYLYFYDCEISYTSSSHFDTLSTLLGNGKILKVGTNSRTQQAWHMSVQQKPVNFINEWSDTHFWCPAPERRIANRIGYMHEGEHTEAHVRMIKDLCEQSGISPDFIKIFGNEKDIIALMQSCDIFLGLNIGKDPLWGEGCPRSPQEAMHAGCVVVAYDVLGNREYLIPNYTGILVPKNDPTKMSQAVVHLLSEPQQKERLRSQGCEFIQSVFSPDSCWPCVKDFLDLGLPEERERLDIEGMPRDTLETLLGGPVYLNQAEIPVLCKYARLSSRLLEIGAAYGASSFILAANSQPNARVWSLDPFVTDSKGTFSSSATLCHGNVHRALSASGHAQSASKWTLINNYSYAVRKTWNDAEPSLDFLFIDGDHNYEAVRKDFEDWAPLVQAGGFILIHDSRREPGAPDHIFNRGWPGPTRLALELQEDARVELVEQAFSLSVFQKK